jgi:hypothetical protein
MPLVVLCAMALVATTAVCLRSLQLNDTARSIVRSAITADDPVEAAQSLARLSNVQIRTTVDTDSGFVTVDVTQAITIPLIGKWMPSFPMHSAATMMQEPPLVMG